MGAVAIFWFFAAAFAMGIACCGKDPRAKLCSAYLLGTWMISNQIFATRPPADTLEAFSYLDVMACGTIYAVAMRWPSRWIFLLLAGLGTQIFMQVAYRLGVQSSDYMAFLLNNLLYGVQLVAVTLPTVAPRRRRRWIDRAPARRRSERIDPPYEGWEPPDGYRG